MLVGYVLCFYEFCVCGVGLRWFGLVLWVIGLLFTVRGAVVVCVIWFVCG